MEIVIFGDDSGHQIVIFGDDPGHQIYTFGDDSGHQRMFITSQASHVCLVLEICIDMDAPHAPHVFSYRYIRTAVH